MNAPVGLKKAGVLCILRSDKGFLLLHRTKDPHIGKYIPLGGKIEPFETPRAAAMREMEEETGIKDVDLKLCGIMTETSPTKFNWITYIYTANIPHSEPIKCSEGTLEWIPEENLNKIPTPTTDLYIYQYIVKSNFIVFDATYNERIELIALKDEINDTLLYEKDSK